MTNTLQTEAAKTVEAATKLQAALVSIQKDMQDESMKTIKAFTETKPEEQMAFFAKTIPAMQQTMVDAFTKTAEAQKTFFTTLFPMIKI